MKKNVYTLTLLFVFTIVSGFTLTTAAKKKAPLGTWHYSTPNAPYGYESGDLVLEKEKGSYKGALIFPGNYSADLYDINIKKDKLSFKAYVEGTEVSFEGTFTKKSIEGTIIYSGGTLTLTAEPKKE